MTAERWPITCPDCRGQSDRLVRVGHAYEYFDQSDYSMEECETCEGKGWTFEPEKQEEAQ